MLSEWRNYSLSKVAGRFSKKEVRQVLYAIFAALFCFVGPTYFVAIASRIISQTYAIALGFVCFLVGIILVFRMVKE